LGCGFRPIICPRFILNYGEIKLAITRTLTIIKPDAVKANNIGNIIQILDKNQLKIVAMRMMHLSKKQAEGFYAVHSARPFFGSLTDFMSSGPVVVMALEGEDAIPKLRNLMGATDPAKADAGTVRKLYGTNIEFNAIHGSDAPETAAFEIGYYFAGLDIVR
jgi:nucleoside-diphosphate kinase